MLKNWKLSNLNPQLVLHLSDSLDINPIIAQLLINRGITQIEDASRFLKADISLLHDPFLLKNMKDAVKRILLAKERNEKVLVFGDYDVDGVTSSAILNKVLTDLGINIIHHIPHRVHDGYGLNEKVALFAKEKKADLVIAVDCGITAAYEVDLINKEGIDVIIIDHHEPPHDKLPEACAIINPKQKDCDYPFKNLASVGLVTKLAQALLGKVPHECLDLVALGTIADIVPLVDENRIFVKTGLPQISQTSNKGLAALMQTSKITGKKMSPYHVGFILGPRINATGRMDSAHRSLDLFLSKNVEEAYQLACVLEDFNTQRQKLQRDVVQEALELVEQQVNFKDSKVLVLSKQGWHKGVLGIVASRLTDKYYRPSIVISIDNGIGTASARSIDGFHLHDALSSCAECLEGFGGHQGAAGLTIKEENIESFKRLINLFADKMLNIQNLIPILDIDQEIPLASINMKLADTIDHLQPFGEGNPSPLFCTRNLRIKGTPLGLGKDTLKMWVTDGNVTLPALGFGMGSYRQMLKQGDKVHLAYQIEIDDWNKQPTVQLTIKDIKFE